MRKFLNFVKHFLAALGVVAVFVTILQVFAEPYIEHWVSKCPLVYLIIFVVLALAYAVIRIYPKNRIKLRFSDKLDVQVFFGDLFDSAGIIVIPVNEYFDTIVDDKIISSNTIHGKFVQQFFGGDEANLKKQIKSKLAECTPIETNLDRKAGNKKRYPLGTVCEVKKSNRVFFLVALTRFNANNRAEIKNSEYQRVLCNLLSFIEQYSQGREVNIPLIGAGHSGLNLSKQKQKLLEFLLFSIALKDELTLINGVNIVLHDSIKSDVDLSSTKLLFKTIRI